MLPPFIIEQIRRREEEARRRREDRDRPRLEVPPDIYRPAPEAPQDNEQVERGIVILDLG
ncbi:MAG: hypothetical protein JW751_10060 [Polyangiaceae bacterium]|nr:hypothetical protein [Polyangiaceae bacterium]